MCDPAASNSSSSNSGAPTPEQLQAAEKAERETAKNAYCNACSELERQMSESYDKHLIALSGGAFGVSFIFLKDIAGTDPRYPYLMAGAWAFWAIALFATMASFLSSIEALRHASRKCFADKLNLKRPGGRWEKYTVWLNLLSGICLVLGVLLCTSFAFLNFGHRHEQNHPPHDTHQDSNGNKREGNTPTGSQPESYSFTIIYSEKRVNH